MTFPTSVKAGLVTMTLTNSDDILRSAQIVRLEGGHTVSEFLKTVVNNEGEGGEAPPIPDWAQDGGGVATVKPGKSASVTQVLAPGKYGIWDDEGEDTQNNALGARGEFTVTGEAVDATLPAQPATVTVTDDGDDKYGFEFKGLKAGTNNVRFENTGEQLHHAQFFPLKKGATIKQTTAFLSASGQPEGPPPVDFEKGVGTSVIDGDIAQSITLDLPAGRYAVICFINDREGGKSHYQDGMIEELTIK